jgi:hypothetical protein
MSRSQIIVVILGALAGCGERVKIDVECKSTPDSSLDCTLTETKGKAEAEACWDVSIKCKNGTVVSSPRSCTKVKDGGTAHYVIDKAKLTNLDKCDGGTTMTMENMTIDGKKAD